jgi:hypothetical protein
MPDGSSISAFERNRKDFEQKHAKIAKGRARKNAGSGGLEH